MRTPYFLIVETPTGESVLDSQAPAPLPRDYLEFAHNFGNARLFRTKNRYRMLVFVPPKPVIVEDRKLWNFGRVEDSHFYFEDLSPNSEKPNWCIVQWTRLGGFKRTANCFREWVLSKWNSCKLQYTKREWNDLLAGPLPFADREQAIVEARRKVLWRVVEVGADGVMTFEVHNTSELTLAYRTIGVSGQSVGDPLEQSESYIFFDVSHIEPGQICQVSHPPPVGLLSAGSKVFDPPDPEPWNRDRYWEFRTLSATE